VLAKFSICTHVPRCPVIGRNNDRQYSKSQPAIDIGKSMSSPKKKTNRLGGRSTATGVEYEVKIATCLAVKMLVVTGSRY